MRRENDFQMSVACQMEIWMMLLVFGDFSDLIDPPDRGGKGLAVEFSADLIGIFVDRPVRRGAAKSGRLVSGQFWDAAFAGNTV